MDQPIGQVQSQFNIENADWSREKAQATETLRILLDSVKAEYEAEQERASAFEGRSGILLTLLSALLVYDATSFAIPQNTVGIKIASILVSMELISILSLIVAIFSTLTVLRPREFHRLDCRNMLSEIEPGSLMIRLINAYNESTRLAGLQIAHRETRFKAAIFASVIGVLALVLSRIIQVYVS